VALDPVVGSRIAAESTFRISGVPTDPTIVVVYVRSPNGVLTTATYPTTDLTQESVGTYRYEFTANVAGSWAVRFEGTGAVEAAGEQFIVVSPSRVL
jgi:hypothetical protein